MKIEAWMQAGIVLALSAFLVWNQASYLSMTWKPIDSAFGAPLATTIGEKLGAEAHMTLESFLGVLTRQRKRAIKRLDSQMLDMSDATHNVAAAANEKKSGAVLASIQSTITRLANGESVNPVDSTPAPLSRRGGSRLEESRLAYRKGMTKEQLARKVGISTKTAGRHIAQLTNEQPVPFAVRKRA